MSSGSLVELVLFRENPKRVKWIIDTSTFAWIYLDLVFYDETESRWLVVGLSFTTMENSNVAKVVNPTIARVT